VAGGTGGVAGPAAPPDLFRRLRLGGILIQSIIIVHRLPTDGKCFSFNLTKQAILDQ
jgi:hypothetical protein